MAGLYLFIRKMPNSGHLVVLLKAKLVLVLFFVVAFPGSAIAKITHVAFVVNKTGNGGKAGKVWGSQIAPLLTERLAPLASENQATALSTPTYEVAFTTGSNSGTQISRDVYDRWSSRSPDEGDQLLIVAAGGDGTVSDVVQPFANVSDARVEFGIFPIGTANELACSLGLSGQSWPRTLETLLDGDSRRIGAYEVNAPLRTQPSDRQTVYAIDEVDIGFMTRASEVKHDHDTGERPQRLLSITPRSFVYTASALTYAFRWLSPKLKLIFGDQSIINDAGMFLAYTGSSSGGFFQLFPNMAPDNPEGQSLTSTKSSGLMVLSELALGRSSLVRRNFQSVRVSHPENCEPEIIQIDGELRLQTPAEIKWVEDLFTFKVPPKK